jgi:hypothetical protein
MNFRGTASLKLYRAVGMELGHEGGTLMSGSSALIGKVKEKLCEDAVAAQAISEVVRVG